VVISRQKVIGWILIAVSVAYIAYFLRVRLFAPGPILEKKEWRCGNANARDCPVETWTEVVSTAWPRVSIIVLPH
jgi:hypothetical protein